MIHEYANCANKTICMSDHEIKGLSLSFYLVPILAVYDTYQLQYHWLCMYAHIIESTF